MTNRLHMLAGALFALLFVTPSGAKDYLYTPAPLDSDAVNPEGVLVREVTVKKGDTLYHLSRQFSGRGGYYPQILLFNELKNPNLIYPGEVLRIPVSHRSDTVAEQRPGKKTIPAARKKRPSPESATAPGKGGIKAPERKIDAAATAASDQNGEHSRYARIQETLKRGDCKAALPLLDNFIASYPNSSLAPEATLSRAECYLKISAQ